MVTICKVGEPSKNHFKRSLLFADNAGYLQFTTYLKIPPKNFRIRQELIELIIFNVGKKWIPFSLFPAHNPSLVLTELSLTPTSHLVILHQKHKNKICMYNLHQSLSHLSTKCNRCPLIQLYQGETLGLCPTHLRACISLTA
jgi:hypothetical protein